jgi:hypothetical protein
MNVPTHTLVRVERLLAQVTEAQAQEIARAIHADAARLEAVAR